MATVPKAEYKHSYSDWFTNIHAQSRAASDARLASFNLMEKDKAMRIETDIKTRYDQRDTNARIADRIWTIRQWRDELIAQLRRLKERMAELRDAKKLTEEHLVKLMDAQQVNTEALTFFDRRRYGELVLDPVEQELKNEQTMLKEIYDEQQSKILEAFEALLRMQDLADSLHAAIVEKNETLDVDIDQYNLNERSANVGFKPLALRKATNAPDLQSWEDLNRSLLEKAVETCALGAEVVHALHHSLHQAANRMGAKADRVADAVRLRIHETERAIRELDYQYQATEENRERLFEELRNLEESRRAKYASLKLAQTRLDGRHNRPVNEKVEDAAHAGLLDEVNGIGDSIDALDERIDKSRHMLGRLEDQLSRLCQETEMKKEAVQIYRELMNLRKKLEVPPKTRHPYCPMLPRGIVRQPEVV